MGFSFPCVVEATTRETAERIYNEYRDRSEHTPDRRSVWSVSLQTVPHLRVKPADWEQFDPDEEV